MILQATPKGTQNESERVGEWVTERQRECALIHIAPQTHTHTQALSHTAHSVFHSSLAFRLVYYTNSFPSPTLTVGLSPSLSLSRSGHLCTCMSSGRATFLRRAHLIGKRWRQLRASKYDQVNICWGSYYLYYLQAYTRSKRRGGERESCPDMSGIAISV